MRLFRRQKGTHTNNIAEKTLAAEMSVEEERRRRKRKRSVMPSTENTNMYLILHNSTQSNTKQNSMRLLREKNANYAEIHISKNFFENAFPY